MCRPPAGVAPIADARVTAIHSMPRPSDYRPAGPSTEVRRYLPIYGASIAIWIGTYVAASSLGSSNAIDLFFLGSLVALCVGVISALVSRAIKSARMLAVAVFLVTWYVCAYLISLIVR